MTQRDAPPASASGSSSVGSEPSSDGTSSTGAAVTASPPLSPPDVILLTAVASATFAVYGGMVVATGPTLPSIAREFNLTLGGAGTVFAVGGAGFLLVVFLAGYAADALGKRVVLLSGLALSAVGLLGLGLAPSFGAFLAAAFVENVASGLLESSVGGLVVDLHPNRRASALNLLHSFFGWGALLGPLLAGALLLTASWRWVYLALALGFLALLPFALRLRFPPATGAEPVRWREMRGLVGSRLIQVSILGMSLYVAGEMSTSAWTFPYLETVRSYPTLLASLGVSAFWAGIAAGRAGSSWLATHLAPARLIQVGAGLAAVGTLGLLVAPSPEASVVALLVAGLGSAPAYPTIMAMACGRFPRLSGSVTGLITSATATGFLVGPALVGRLGDALGLQLALLAVAGAMVLVAALYALPWLEEG